MSSKKALMSMKWLWILPVILTAGCQDETFGSRGVIGNPHAAAANSERKSFSTPPNELQSVLAELRKQTGWKLKCEEGLEKELIYLRFNNKTEQEVAMALGQVLLANFPIRDGAMTLSHTHASIINEIMFRNEIYLGRIKPHLDELSTASREMSFQPGFALEKIKADLEILPQLFDSKNESAWSRRATLSPGGRAASAFLNIVSDKEFASIELEKPIVWATNPIQGQRPMDEQMDIVIDQLVQESMEWNGAYSGAQARGMALDRLPLPPRFSPRDNFEVRLQRGRADLGDTTSFTINIDARSRSGQVTPISWIVFQLVVKPQPSDDADPKFAEKVKGMTQPLRTLFGEKTDNKPSDPPRDRRSDLRLSLLELTLEHSANHSENIVANLDSRILDRMVRLTMSNRHPTAPMNPDAILLENHAKFKMPQFVMYRPHLLVYARLDRNYWEKRGSGIHNSPWSHSPSGIVK